MLAKALVRIDLIEHYRLYRTESFGNVTVNSMLDEMLNQMARLGLIERLNVAMQFHFVVDGEDPIVMMDDTNIVRMSGEMVAMGDL